MGALAVLRAAGLQVQVLPDGRLRVTPAHLLTDELRALIREHRAAILAELAPSGPSAGEVAAIRRRYRENAAALLAELEVLSELSEEQQTEAAYYRSVVTPRPKRMLARVEAMA